MNASFASESLFGMVRRGMILLACGAVAGGMTGCTMGSSNTYYPQAKDEEAYLARHKALKDELADDEDTILQSHNDARRGLNLPPDSRGYSNDGTGWTSYR